MLGNDDSVLRSEGSVEAAKRALAEVGRKSVGRSARVLPKLENRGIVRVRSGFDDEIRNVKPNAMVEVVVELPASLVAAAGACIGELVYDGLRNTLTKLGVQWFGRRFLVRLRTNTMKAANKRKFTY